MRAKILGTQSDGPLRKPEEYCEALREWADLYEKSIHPMLERRDDLKEDGAGSRFAAAWRTVEMAISKSCLLDRVFYGGERPSQTPCPVHKGIWSGVHIGWPGQELVRLPAGPPEPVEVSPQLQEFYDAGCRCFQHSCGCTTGWQPDEYCGCSRVGDASHAH